MLKWFRPGLPPHQTALAMIGAKAGDHVRVVGHIDPTLAAEVARVTGLNGQTLVMGPPASKTAVDAAAATAGTLVEFLNDSELDAGAPADIVVLGTALAGLAGGERLALLRTAFERVRPGGRLIAMDVMTRGGFFGGPKATAPSPGEVVSAMTSAGAVAARVLGDADGTTYYEARRAR
jgi:hypothetical protein